MRGLTKPLQSLLTAAAFCLIALCGVTAPALAAEVIEFYNVNLDNYFITADAGEAAAIDGGSAGPGWSRTGNAFGSGGSTSVCRFYGSQSPGPNSHFHTVDPGECAGLRQLQATTPATQKRWNFESLDFVSTPATGGACPAGLAPVYRAYNNGFARGVDSNHRITGDLAGIQQVVDRGWTSEGVVMCAPSITCSGGINRCGSAAANMTIRVTVPSNTPAADTIWLRQLNAGIVELDVQMTKIASGPDVWQASVSVPQGTIFRYWYRHGSDLSKAETYPPAAADGGFFYREALATNSATVSNKPFLFNSVGYYSANTSAMQLYGVYARELDDFSPALATPVSDYDEQARAYQATLLAFAATPWVQGCYSFGYAYSDHDPKGYSIRSKTAEEIMSQIYQKLNGM